MDNQCAGRGSQGCTPARPANLVLVWLSCAKTLVVASKASAANEAIILDFIFLIPVLVLLYSVGLFFRAMPLRQQPFDFESRRKGNPYKSFTTSLVSFFNIVPFFHSDPGG